MQSHHKNITSHNCGYQKVGTKDGSNKVSGKYLILQFSILAERFQLCEFRENVLRCICCVRNSSYPPCVSTDIQEHFWPFLILSFLTAFFT